MSTTDPTDPRLGHGVDDAPVPQNDAYLVMSDAERARGFVQPVRLAYQHVGAPGPKHATRELTEAEQQTYVSSGYVLYEEYPEGSVADGRFWTQAQLDEAKAGGCGAVTTMAQSIAETYAANPGFYGATYCVGCSKHRPVGEYGEFV